MNDFFVSYNKADRAWAEWIAWTLEEVGYKTVIQAWDFRPGGDFVLDMHAATSTTARTIAVLSDAYLSAEFTHPEWANAFARDPKGENRLLIPVLVSNCQVEGLLKTRTHEKLVGLTEDAARQRLLDCVKDRAKPDSRPKFPSELTNISTVKRHFPGGPNYPDASIRELSERLQVSLARRDRLRGDRVDDSTVVAEIVDLKKQILLGGQLRPGAVLDDGRYLLYDVIGRGGYSQIWRARDRKNEQSIAMKVLHSEKSSHPVSRRRFFRGAETMSRLAGTGVVTVLEDRCETDGYCFFTMELVEGGNLREAVLNKRFLGKDLVAVVKALANTLAVAHSRPERYVHRDVKPTNVLLASNNRLLLSDFDLVAAEDTAGGTRTGAALGSLPYAAPEQLHQPNIADCRADIFSLAMTGVFVAFGKDLPHLDAYTPEFQQELPVEAGIRNVLAKALSRRPEDRFQTMEEFSSALTEKQKPSRKPRRRQQHIKRHNSQPPRHTPPPGKKWKVEKALNAFDDGLRGRGHYKNFEANSRHSYAIAHKGKLYPVKKIISLATGLPTGNFSGGAVANTWFTELGFEIVELRATTRGSIGKDHCEDQT